MCIYIYTYTLGCPLPVTTIVWCLHQQQERQLWRKQTSTGHGPTVVQTHPANFHWKTSPLWFDQKQLEKKPTYLIFVWQKKQLVLIFETSTFKRLPPTTGNLKSSQMGLAKLLPLLCCFLYLRVWKQCRPEFRGMHDMDCPKFLGTKNGQRWPSLLDGLDKH